MGRSAYVTFNYLNGLLTSYNQVETTRRPLSV